MFQTPTSPIPPPIDLETKKVLKRLTDANRELAALNGFSRTIPNRYVLINALSLQEAKDSSEIENIVTTNDELYRASVAPEEPASLQAKEVRDYAEALLEGFRLVEGGELLTINNICAIQRRLEHNTAGIRSQPGTTIKNRATGEVVHTPPQDRDEIVSLLGNLERIVNDDSAWPDVDPLLKMAVIHYQFETIHPFYDGNGRTGRIVNVLYLVLKKLLDAPILYLSRYIISHKGEYYRQFDEIRKRGNWESFILFMLDAVVETSRMTTKTIGRIDEAISETKHDIQKRFKFYSRDLVEALYLYPYTRIQHLQKHLGISRPTATAYLNKLADAGILRKISIGHNLYFVNRVFYEILAAIPSESDSSAPVVVTENSGNPSPAARADARAVGAAPK